MEVKHVGDEGQKDAEKKAGQVKQKDKQLTLKGKGYQNKKEYPEKKKLTLKEKISLDKRKKLEKKKKLGKSDES